MPEILIKRLNELSDAVTKGRESVAREFTMRVPAEPDRDADLVLAKAAMEIDRLTKEVKRLKARHEEIIHGVVFGGWNEFDCVSCSACAIKPIKE